MSRPLPHGLRHPSVLGLVVLVLLSACGAEAPPTPTSEVPADPDKALAWVEAAGEGESAAELDRRLALWPLDASDFQRAEASQIALTWRLQRALASSTRPGTLEAAHDAHVVLQERFDGAGLSRLRRVLSPRLLRLGIAEASSKAARAAIEGGRPDPSRATFALDLAGNNLTPSDEEWKQLTRLKKWVQLDSLKSLGHTLPAHTGPRVVVFSDTFALGEAVLPSVLGRWQREHAKAGLRITLVPVRTGQVRIGLRRLPAASPKAEWRVFTEAKKRRHIELAKPVELDFIRSWGRVHGSCLLLVADRHGRVVGRMSGHTLDARELEPVVQRVVSR